MGLLASCWYAASYKIPETPITTATKCFGLSFKTKISDQCGIRNFGNCWGAVEQVLWNEGRKFWRSSPRWWEVSDPLHTNSIDRLCTQPYHNPVRKSWLFLSWLVGQLEFQKLCLFFCCFTESSPVPKIQQIICLLLCVLTTLDKIRLSGKFHPVLSMEQEI